MSKEVRYGFQWGPMLVERWAHFRHHTDSESYVLGVTAGKNKVEVYVSRTGRSVRVWKNGKELT